MKGWLHHCGIIHSILLFSPVLFLSVCSCNHDPKPVNSTANIRFLNDTVINYNRNIAKTEDQEIKDFISRYKWSMSKTSTGLRYMIYRQGNGKQAKTGLKAVIQYEVRLINGDLCYSSKKSGPKEFVIGYGGVESGIEEGILLMKEGDRAKFIVPSRLAFGLLGDQKLIPPQATLIYDVELIKLKINK